MKQKDIILILVIVFISAVASFVLSNIIFAPPKNRQQKVEVIRPITADFPLPDSHYFNANANDPTKLITIGQNTNADPFSSTATQ